MAGIVCIFLCSRDTFCIAIPDAWCIVIPSQQPTRGLRFNEGMMMTKRIVKLVCKTLGLRVPEKYLPGRVVEFSAAELTNIRAAYSQSTEGQW